MPPPLPPPGVPARAGLAPLPTASFQLITLLRITHDTPMLLMAPPLEHSLPRASLPPNVLLVTYTGWLSYWLSTRTAPPPTSGPVVSQRFWKNREFTIFTRPPRTNTAPPPPPSKVSPVALPAWKVRFWMVRRGWSWFWQCGVVHTWAGSQVFM